MIKNKKNPAEKKPKTEESELLLGIDYGERNIGTALGRNGLAIPIKILPSKDRATALNEIVKMVHQNKISKIIMGLPLNYEGKETPQARKVREFTKLLKIKVKKPVEFVNEYGSTMESVERAVEDAVSQKKRRELDHFSAAIILKKYYDSL